MEEKKTASKTKANNTKQISPKKPHGLKGKPTNNPNAWHSSPINGDDSIRTKPGDNTKYASMMLEMLSWPPVDVADVKQLEDRLYLYLDYCMRNDVRMGNQACYFALGISKENVYDWEHGLRRDKAHADFVKKVRKLMGVAREVLMQDGKLNPATGIFWQKNYDGLKDEQNVVLRPESPLGQEMSQDDIQRAVAALPDAQ